MPLLDSPALNSGEFDLLLGWLLNGAPSGIGDSPPMAHAGVDQHVNESAVVVLDASASADDFGISRYAWVQVLGVPVVLSDAAGIQPQFNAPSVSATEILQFELTVSDVSGQVSSDTVQIIVNTLDLAPVANAGSNFTVDEGATAALDGSQSTDDLGIQAYGWEQLSGPTVSVSNATISQPTFPAPSVTGDTVLQFQLTVTDGVGQSSLDTVQVTVNDDAAPLVNAGANQSVTEGTNVMLVGTASDDVGIQTYAWVQTGGSGVTLSSNNSVSTSFTAPDILDTSSELLAFQLTVTDTLGQSASASQQVTVNGVSTDPAPVANAGPDQIVFERDSVTLNGAASTDNSSISAHAWAWVSGPTVSLSSSSAVAPSFVAPSVASTELLVLKLTVTDDNSQTNTDTVQITINNDQAPIAVAGNNQLVNEGDSGSLDGSSSSDDLGIASYAWVQLAGSAAILTGGTPWPRRIRHLRYSMMNS
ncbi:MAG: hypothetical protein JKY01_03355 [Pseudomonadales bacterium]|nr:hypothetical protein [Pseudomonadales bacterium]